MKALRIFFVGAFLSLIVPAFGQVMVTAHEKPPPALVKPIAMSVSFERDLDQALALKPRDPNAIEFDLRFLGDDIPPDLLKTGFRWRLDDDETITLRSRITYRYQPKYWPTGFRDLFKKAVLHPIETFLSKHFD